MGTYQAGEFLGTHNEAPARRAFLHIAYDGGVVMLSPELAGFTDSRFGDFTTGNVLRTGLHVLVAEAEERTPWIAEFWSGVDACRATCPSWRRQVPWP
ncbi:hypothetical protein [Streptomyces sp. NBC_00091]|uniref:hypothetical protein n=1 Tax=Streptomyces sp. NBC_00091 TaxID=2975648 RepID=UPI00224EAF2B|nr:hypothetical protein [Streptomyces sp. NBC_00091]MCX5377663.1 hypothetical protein [Streptomyces sp. NBC_00091]